MIHSDDRCDHVTRRKMILSSLALGFSVSPEQSRQWNASQIERIRRSVDQSRRPYLESENDVFFGKEDDLSKLVGFLETSFEGCARRYGQSFPTIWFLSNQRTLGNSGLFNRVIDMAESANAN